MPNQTGTEKSYHPKKNKDVLKKKYNSYELTPDSKLSVQPNHRTSIRRQMGAGRLPGENRQAVDSTVARQVRSTQPPFQTGLVQHEGYRRSRNEGNYSVLESFCSV